MRVPRKTIEEIIIKFDFALVHEYMRSVGWMWTLPNGVAIPEISDLQATARHLLGRLEVGEVPYAASGGFLAVVTPLDSGGEAALYFTIGDSYARFGEEGTGE